MIGYPKVSINILNWNKWQHLLKCLESVYQITYPNYDVVIVDNASQDGSVEKAKEWAAGKITIEGKFVQYRRECKPTSYIEYEKRDVGSGSDMEKKLSALPSVKKLIILKNERNDGAGKALNFGIKYVLDALNPGYILLLANDVVVAPNALSELIGVAMREPNAGILGPKICDYANPEGVPWSEGGLINYWTGNFIQRGPKLDKLAKGKDAVEVDWMPLNGALLSRQLLQTVGILDETFFWSLEELDLSLRAKEHSFKIMLVPESKIWHDDMSSPEYKRKFSGTRLYYTPRNQLILFRKHWRGLKLISVISFFILANFKYLFLFLLKSRNWDNLKTYARGLWDSLRGR